MATYTFSAGQRTAPIKVDRDSLIQLSPVSATVEYTDQATSAIINNTATWATMTLDAQGRAFITDDIYVRVTASSAGSLVIDANPSAQSLKGYRTDYRTS